MCSSDLTRGFFKGWAWDSPPFFRLRAGPDKKTRGFFKGGALHLFGCECKNSATGTRTRVARVRAEYPNQLDYGGSGEPENCRKLKLRGLATRQEDHASNT